MLEEQRLDARVHDCAGFDCGVPALNEYLRRLATQHRRRGLSQTFVLVDDADIGRVIGYYSLSAAQLDTAALAESDRRRLPRYPIPCIRMGRLAVSLSSRGQGLGRLLVGAAVDRCLRARAEVAAYALIVDAKDDAAVAFYEHYGFARCVDAPRTLYLPL